MSIEEILEQLPHFQQVAQSMRDILLGNLVMIGEIPAPTYNESKRIEMLEHRFNECGLQNCSTDEIGNGLAILPGQGNEKYILLTAHADSVLSEDVDHTVQLHTNAVTGPGLAENSLGLAVLATLPMLLEKLNINLNSGLILMGNVHSVGWGNLEGIRFFLENSKLPIRAGVCIEGAQLGRLSYSSIGMLRGEVSCKVPLNHQWTTFGSASAVILLNQVISKILRIPIPSQPLTRIILGQVMGGTSFNQIAQKAYLRFECRSEVPGITEKIGQAIKDICMEISSKSGTSVELAVVATRTGGGLSLNHPLPQLIRRIHTAMSIKSEIEPTVSELATFISKNIPAVTVGMTKAEYINTERETLEVEPMFKGLAQLLAIIMAIDEGICDGH